MTQNYAPSTRARIADRQPDPPRGTRRGEVLSGRSSGRETTHVGLRRSSRLPFPGWSMCSHVSAPPHDEPEPAVQAKQ